MATATTCNIEILCTGSELVARVVIWQSCCAGTCMSTTRLNSRLIIQLITRSLSGSPRCRRCLHRYCLFPCPGSLLPCPSILKSHSSKIQQTKAEIFRTREDVAAALLVLHARSRLSPSRPLIGRVPTRREARRSPPARRPRVVTPSVADLIVMKVCSDEIC